MKGIWNNNNNNNKQEEKKKRQTMVRKLIHLMTKVLIPTPIWERERGYVLERRWSKFKKSLFSAVCTVSNRKEGRRTKGGNNSSGTCTGNKAKSWGYPSPLKKQRHTVHVDCCMVNYHRTHDTKPIKRKALLLQKKSCLSACFLILNYEVHRHLAMLRYKCFVMVFRFLMLFRIEF